MIVSSDSVFEVKKEWMNASTGGSKEEERQPLRACVILGSWAQCLNPLRFLK